ncbi:MAG: glycosyltransferase family 2 protein [Oscillospiraceae bacterium]
MKKLHCSGMIVDFIFVDDNTNEESSLLLSSFEVGASVVTVLPGSARGKYVCDEESHHWDDNLMLKVAEYKNSIIKHAIKNEYDFLFFVDSDLVLHPGLLEHLKNQKKEIVSEIFWSRWHEGLPLEPNVWLFDEYDLVPKQPGENLSDAESSARRDAFLAQLKIPGLYPVGGLGACTLIKRSALMKGVNFSPIKNLTIHGEDRFFCIRAAVLGIDLYVDTRHPAYHIYRESDLDGVEAYVRKCIMKHSLIRQYKKQGNKITLSMSVRNEEHRYLQRMLKSVAGHIDEAVIIDDASSDETAAICEQELQGIPFRIVRNAEPLFANEVKLRKKQWSETLKSNPDWILNLDADEFIDEAFWDSADEMINNSNCDVYLFRMYDMWTETMYRDDKYWDAHSCPRVFLTRYQPDFQYDWLDKPQHCGRFPSNLNLLPQSESEFRIQHFGWATQADRALKYKRYQLLDPDAVYGVREQYESILSPCPNLVLWQSNGQ